MKDLDPEEGRAIIARARKLMIGACQRYGGYVSVGTRPRRRSYSGTPDPNFFSPDVR